MAAQVAGCTTIIGVDVQPGRPIRAEELGATLVVAKTVDAVEAFKQAPAGSGVDFSIDATGSPQVLAQAVYCTRPGGI
jgi:aryl-alcohol dehydrogenase